MSRSYKKTPWCGDNKGSQKKRQAWKVVRQWLKDNPDVALKGGQYKKLYEAWDICDYGWVTTWEEYWESCQRWPQEAINRGWGYYKDDLDEEKEYRHWYKHYKGK